MERSNISAKRSPPATMMSHVAIKKRCAEIQAPTPPNSRPRIVLMTWSVAQTTDVVRLRAFSEVTLERPMAQAVISATQRRTSTGLGIDLLIGGTKVAATIPVKRAIENWSSSGISTPRERARQHEYWPARSRARPQRAETRLQAVAAEIGRRRDVHIRVP